MKSKIESLQCPCGCELGVPSRLELLYEYFKERGFDVQGLVNCVGSNDTLRVKLTGNQRDVMEQCMKQLGFKFTAEYYPFTDIWHVYLHRKIGVIYA